MRFENYLIEGKNDKYISFSTDDEAHEFAQQVIKDCAKYIKEGFGRKPFYRGTPSDKDTRNSDAILKDVRKDRRPMGTKPKVFSKVNKWLGENGYARRDRSVSVSSSRKASKIFGSYDVFKFFPVGNYKTTFIRSSDFNITDPTTGWDVDFVEYIWDGDRYRDMIREGSVVDIYIPEIVGNKLGIEGGDYRTIETVDEYDNIMKILTKEYLGDNAKEAYKEAYEIWFECDKYYMISESFYDDVLSKNL